MARVVVVVVEGAVAIAAEGAVVLLTDIVEQERLTPTRKSTRAGEATKAVLNLKPRRLGILMPRLRAMPRLPIVGMPCRLILGVHPRRQIPGGNRLRAIAYRLLKTRKLGMIANRKESLKMKIAPCPTINTSHS
jgi:hypothetical protein